MTTPVSIKLITEIKENKNVGQEYSHHIIIPWVNRDVNGTEAANLDVSSSEWWITVEFSDEHNPKTRCSLNKLLWGR